MILLSILLSAGLDLTLPEFEPNVDVSGNVVVSEYDVSSDDFIAIEVPVDQIPAPGVFRAESEQADSDIVSAIHSLNDDNNRYWELFLDSYPINVDHVLRSSYIASSSWKFNANGTVTSAGGVNDHIAYIPVEAGITYYISGITLPSFNSYRIGVVNDLDSPTVVTNFSSGNPETLTVEASQSGFLVFSINYNKEIGFLSQWSTVEQESYTLSELGNAVVEIRSNNEMKFRILIFLTFINFAYPLILSSFKKFFGGDKNV